MITMFSIDQNQKKPFLWAGVLLILFTGILTFSMGSSIITALIAVIGLVLILIWRFA